MREIIKVDKRNETGVIQQLVPRSRGQRNTMKERRQCQIASALLRSSSELSEADEEERDLSDEDVERNCLCRFCRSAFELFLPGWTPLLMYLTLVAITLLVGFINASMGYEVDEFYGLYLSITALLILSILLCRAIWICLFGHGLLFAPLYIASMAAVLDPQTTYLLFTIAILAFWENSLTEMSDVDGVIRYVFLNRDDWQFE